MNPGGDLMGEMADDMIEGYSCSWCGIYFRRPHGFPVICSSCWKQYKYKQNNPKMSTAQFLKDYALQIAFEKEV